jgi:hypothetical protein
LGRSRRYASGIGACGIYCWAMVTLEEQAATGAWRYIEKKRCLMEDGSAGSV